MKQEIKRILDNRAAEHYLIENAEARGKAEEKIALAKKMLDENLDINIISKITGLSGSEIKNLKNQ